MLAAVFKMGYRVHCATKGQTAYSSKDTFDHVSSKEVRLVLVGKTGSGKSKTGNTILGEEVFKSSALPDSVTKTCMYGRTVRLGYNIIVVDTPGFMDTELEKEGKSYDKAELLKCLGLASPGPHAFLFVLKAGERRRKEDKEIIEEFKLFFGPNILEYAIVVFTGADDLEEEDGIKSVDEYIKTLPEEIRSTLKTWGNRSILFNNKGNNSIKEKQVKELLDLVYTMSDTHYTNEMFKAAEEALKIKEAQMREEMEKKGEMLLENAREVLREKMEESDFSIMQLLVRAIKIFAPYIVKAVERYFRDRN